MTTPWPFPCPVRRRILGLPLRRCPNPVPATMPVCFAHWAAAPQPLRDAVSAAIRDGREDDLAAAGAALVAALQQAQRRRWLIRP